MVKRLVFQGSLTINISRPFYKMHDRAGVERTLYKNDCLLIGKWQNSTPHRIKTPKLIAKKLSWVIRSARRLAMPNLVVISLWGVFWGDADF